MVLDLKFTVQKSWVTGHNWNISAWCLPLPLQLLVSWGGGGGEEEKRNDEHSMNFVSQLIHALWPLACRLGFLLWSKGASNFHVHASWAFSGRITHVNKMLTHYQKGRNIFSPPPPPQHSSRKGLSVSKDSNYQFSHKNLLILDNE